MKKFLGLMLLFAAVASSAFAEGDMVTREAERSGVAGTCNMIGNSVSGFFSTIGGALHRATHKE